MPANSLSAYIVPIGATKLMCVLRGPQSQRSKDWGKDWRERDSNPRCPLQSIHDFQSCSFSHSDISPHLNSKLKIDVFQKLCTWFFIWSSLLRTRRTRSHCTNWTSFSCSFFFFSFKPHHASWQFF